MRLNDAEINHSYIVTHIESVDEIYNSRIGQLGFFPGAEIRLIKKAPFFKDPLLFNLGESQIAMTRQEASHILIEDIVATGK